MNAYPLAYTGELPVQALGAEFGGRDDFAFADWRHTGCLDAPDLLPAGSHRNANFDQVPVSRYIDR